MYFGELQKEINNKGPESKSNKSVPRQHWERSLWD